MTIELYIYKELSRTYTGNWKRCKEVRNQWIKDIKNLTGIFYIIIKP